MLDLAGRPGADIGSLFGALPRPRQRRTALLLDGNIGLGDDALRRRVDRTVIAPGVGRRRN